MLDRRSALQLASMAAMSSLFGCQAQNESDRTQTPQLKLAVSIYVGWVPWMLAAENGVLASNAKAAGLDIRVVRGDYAETIDQYINGHVDALVITTIDALAAFAEAKLLSDVILIGSFSAGNDAILARSEGPLPDGANIGLVENSVSDYLLERYLASQQRSRASINVTGVSDADLASAFARAGDDLAAVATWNPIVSSLEQNLGAKRLFDSKQIPREIADALVVRRSALENFPQFGQALLRTWFDIMQAISREPAPTIDALARLSASSADDYRSQLASTELIDTRDKAITAMQDKTIATSMEKIAEFVQARGLAKTDRPNWFGLDAASPKVLRFNTALLQALKA
jgi:NitT/TauT family transport system substrate-binding protein